MWTILTVSIGENINKSRQHACFTLIFCIFLLKLAFLIKFSLFWFQIDYIIVTTVLFYNVLVRMLPSPMLYPSLIRFCTIKSSNCCHIISTLPRFLSSSVENVVFKSNFLPQIVPIQNKFEKITGLNALHRVDELTKNEVYTIIQSLSMTYPKFSAIKFEK